MTILRFPLPLRGALAALCVTLAACGAGLSGDYGNEMVTYTFHSDGTVEQSSLGMTIKLKYELKGRKLEIQTPQGTLVYEMRDDGAIDTPFGVLKKR
ncbi:hypothetical protein [Bordetella genomosp. 13]|uniref:hypothetical protein n=1 Tax=Bordetella genomosp. 13 TaxID=463040 RepID=UPI0011A94B10|nr:hypothetical protein [Bordetella genomosp. 13]